VDAPAGRVWPLVEVVDRGEEGPGGGIILERTRHAIRGVVSRGGAVFVHVPRRGYAPAFRCVQCGTLRRCAVCGAGPDRGETCRRCGAPSGPCAECGGARFQAIGAAVGRVIDDLGRALGGDVGAAGSGAPVIVGTERDLPGAGTVDLAVAIDPDGMWLAPNFRAEEEALRILARVAGAVRHSRGRRCLIQTADPDHRVVLALRSGRGVELMREIVAERAKAGLPPIGALIAVEVRGDRDATDGELRDAVQTDGDVFGPAEAGPGWRWLVQGDDLHRARVRLRSAVQAWRGRGWAVRVDADPLDL
jgi:primosomal protein N' (replication factor Y)